MEKLNLNFNGGDNIIKSICWVLSLLSWLLYLITGWISLFDKKFYVWTIPKNTKFKTISKYFYLYIPIQIEEVFIYIIIIATLGISTAAFCVYLFYSICNKSKSVFNGMMDTIGRFHFIPLACAGGLFLIGETLKDSDNGNDLIKLALVFSGIGLITLIISYFRINMEPWTASLLVKKGAFSCLIALFTYSIFYSILQIGIIEELNTFKIQDIFDFISGNKKKVIDFINNCGTALPIVIGFVNLSLSFALKSPMISVMNLLIYIGMTIYYYHIDEYTKDFFKNNGDGVIEIIMIVLSAVTCGLLIFFYKTDALK